MPGEARVGGNFADWTADEAYQFIRDALKKEASHVIVERPPRYIEATQGRGRFIRRFELSLEATPEGILLRGRITSPTDWPAHVRRALLRLAASLIACALGVAFIGVALADHLDGWPIVASILLFAGGATAAVIFGGLYGNAKLMNEGRDLVRWLGSSNRP